MSILQGINYYELTITNPSNEDSATVVASYFCNRLVAASLWFDPKPRIRRTIPLSAVQSSALTLQAFVCVQWYCYSMISVF